MGTPNKQQIYEKARELWYQDQHRNGCSELAQINPEYSELLENGYVHSARTMLMSSNPNVVVIEKNAKSEKEELTLDDHFLVDIEELLRSGCFIVGGKGTTKSNMAKIIADKLRKLGYVVKVFDISKVWLKSSVPFYVEVRNCHKLNVDLYQSVVYDLSSLVPNDVKRFVSQTLAYDWNRQINIPEYKRKWIVYIFEEVQILIPQGRLRSNEAQQILRLLTSGRNYQFSAIAITQRTALTDTSVFELCFQKYFARMDGENDLRKAAAYIGSERAKELENLKLGEFIYDKGSETKKISTREFKPKAVPKKLENVLRTPSLPEQAIKSKKIEHQIDTEALSSVAIALIFLLAIWIAVGGF